MSHDPARIAEARAWFLKARSDLRAGEIELSTDPPLLDQVVFNAQQAAEKSMKGFLAWHDRAFRKTHNLVEIGRACAEIDGGLDLLLRRAAPLTEYAWRFRYPGDPEDPSEDEAREALLVARELYGALLFRMPEDVRPTDS